MAITPGDRIGPYEIVSGLGAGGMGEVYLARDARLDRQVAIKILRPAFAKDADRLRRFEREAKTLAALNHLHIAHIYGLESPRRRPWSRTDWRLLQTAGCSSPRAQGTGRRS